MSPASCSFGAILLIVNLLIKTDFTVICVPCMLEHVRYEPFFKMQIYKISYVIIFVYCLKFTPLTPYIGK